MRSYTHSVPLPRAIEHLSHVVKDHDREAIAIAAHHVRQAGGTLDLLLPGTGSTPLALSVWSGRVDCARTLLEAGADPNVPIGQGNTPLHRAVHCGHVSMVELLLAFGADPGLRNQQGLTPQGLAHDVRTRVMLERTALQHTCSSLNDEQHEEGRSRRRL